MQLKLEHKKLVVKQVDLGLKKKEAVKKIVETKAVETKLEEPKVMPKVEVRRNRTWHRWWDVLTGREARTMVLRQASFKCTLAGGGCGATRFDGAALGSLDEFAPPVVPADAEMVKFDPDGGSFYLPSGRKVKTADTVILNHDGKAFAVNPK